jgi:hypothetical protein
MLYVVARPPEDIEAQYGLSIARTTELAYRAGSWNAVSGSQRPRFDPLKLRRDLATLAQQVMVGLKTKPEAIL